MQELVAVLNENARMAAEVQQLENDLQSQVHTVGCQLCVTGMYLQHLYSSLFCIV